MFVEWRLLRLNSDETFTVIEGIRGRSGTPIHTIEFNGILYASAGTVTFSNNRKLFRINNDNSTTQLLNTFSGDEFVGFNLKYNGKLYFRISNGLTSIIHSIDNSGVIKSEFSFSTEGITNVLSYIGYNNRLYFTGSKVGGIYLFRLKDP